MPELPELGPYTVDDIDSLGLPDFAALVERIVYYDVTTDVLTGPDTRIDELKAAVHTRHRELLTSVAVGWYFQNLADRIFDDSLHEDHRNIPEMHTLRSALSGISDFPIENLVLDCRFRPCSSNGKTANLQMKGELYGSFLEMELTVVEERAYCELHVKEPSQKKSPPDTLLQIKGGHGFSAEKLPSFLVRAIEQAKSVTKLNQEMRGKKEEEE